jgi:hypothetical protein
MIYQWLSIIVFVGFVAFALYKGKPPGDDDYPDCAA